MAWGMNFFFWGGVDMDIQLFQSSLLKKERLYFIHSIAFASLLQNSCLYVSVFLDSVWFDWSIFPCWWQQCIILIILVLKSGSYSSSFFCTLLIWAVLGPLLFQMNLKISFEISLKMLDFDWDFTKVIIHFGTIDVLTIYILVLLIYDVL